MSERATTDVTLNIGFAGQTSRFRMYDSDVEIMRLISKAIKDKKLYEADVSSAFCAVLRPGDTVIDVGANIGWFTLLAASIVGETGRVFSFEPAPENVSILRDNVLLNNYSQVEVCPVAVSDSVRQSNFYLNPDGNGGHAMWDMQDRPNNTKTSTVIQSDTQTLDSKEFKSVRMLKIDTEGHELRVLSGAIKLLSEFKPDYVICEYHPWGLAAHGDTQQGLRRLMSLYGYSTHLLLSDIPLPLFIPPGTNINAQVTQNLLFTTPEHLSGVCPELKIISLDEEPAA